MFPVLIPLRQRIALCFHALHDGMVRWMKPCSTSLLLGTITDLAKGKSELLVENALLRKPLVILHRQVKRPAYRKTDRFLLVLLARMVRTWKQALFIVQPETLLRGPRGLFRVFWKHKSRARSREPKLSPETIVLIKEMAANNRLWGAERIRGELLKLDIRRSQTDHSEVYEADSRHFELVDRDGGLSCAIMRQRCGPAISSRSLTFSSVRSLLSFSSS